MSDVVEVPAAIETGDPRMGEDLLSVVNGALTDQASPGSRMAAKDSTSMPTFDPTVNPLASDSPAAWDGLIEAVGPASLLVVIDARMSPALKRRQAPEDILQEGLLHAWRDRAKCEWRGIRSFRSWLLSIIDNRIRDAATHDGAAKRGGGRAVTPFSVLEQSESGDDARPQFAGPIVSTTPSRVAIQNEQAAAMTDALAALPDEVRDVVRLRLFDQRSIQEIAGRLDIGESAVRHRFRRGAEMYHARLRTALVSRSQAVSRESTTLPPSDSASEE